ncbi:MAG TPA: ion channel [Ignavibacteria bacterium]
MSDNLLNQSTNGVEVQNLGLSNRDITKGERLMKRDGTFNSRRVGLQFLETFNFYHYLVTVSWWKFSLIILSGYIALNCLFAIVYYLLGVDTHLVGVIAANEIQKFFEAFFFSAQSFTTVGYGRISPVGFWASSVAAFESLVGLMCLAIATGLFYGRFSRPVAKILFSEKALIAPFEDVTGFQFRMANKNRSEIIDVEVRVMFSVMEVIEGAPSRKFYNLKLEYNKINFFSLVWTVNHPINEKSPLYGLTNTDLTRGQAEFIILLQGYDDTFSQNVHARNSYRYDEIVWGAKFTNIYGFDEKNRTIVNLDRISEYRRNLN